MQMSLLKVLLNNISSFFELSSCNNKTSEPIWKYYQKAERILKFLKPVLDAIVGTQVASDELLNKAFEDLVRSVDKLKELFGNWQRLQSKVYFVMQIESLLSEVRSSSIDIFESLKSSQQHLLDELNPASFEDCVQKIKHTTCEQILSVIKDAIKEQAEGTGPSSEALIKIEESLGLMSNQDILIEAVALEKAKENAEQAENTEEAEYIDQIIALVTSMHDRLAMIKHSQSGSPVPIPADFCCPLSLELMTDPVIVASGQTYERASITKWLDLGFTVCPKTRQTLAHTNLIPNYTVKALIANWCESNNIKLPDRIKSLGLDQSARLAHADSVKLKDSHSRPHSIGGEMVLPESGMSIEMPSRNFISSRGHLGVETSPLHPRSKSEGSYSGVVENCTDLDIGKISLTNSRERTLDSNGHPLMPPSRQVFSGTDGHNRSTSDSDSVSNIREAIDGSDTSTHLTANTSEPSADVKSELQTATSLANPLREPQMHTRMEARLRSQTIWRRPSERLIPRIVSSTTEMRADLSGVEAQVRKLVEDLKNPSVETQRETTAELRLLAKHNMDNRIVIANCGAISLLVSLLHSADTKIQDNAVTALLNLSINDNNKIAIANAGAIEPLIHVLETGSPEARENSAATLFSLSVIEDNKIKIGRSGAIKSLVELLGNGTPRGKKDAATALFNLSIYHENKARIVQAGAVKHLVDLMDPAAGMVDKAVAVLANLATIPEGRTAIGQESGIPVLVEVVELGSARGKENAAAALLQLCTTSNRYCSMVLQEGAVPPLVALSQNGTPRAKEKALALLSYFRNQRHGNPGRG